MKKHLIGILVLCTSYGYSQNLNLPSYSEGAPNNYFTAGNGDGGTLNAYNVFLRLHTGIAFGSPFVSNGAGGLVEKATLAIDGRTGDLITMGSIRGEKAVFSGNVGIGTNNPSAWFPGKVLEITDNRPIIKLSPRDEGGLATILFKGAYNSNNGSKDEFHLNYISSQSNPRLVLAGYNGNGEPSIFTMLGNGNVGIGTENPSTKLAVNGNIRAREIKVETNNWPDYVFHDAYNLPSLQSIKEYISKNQHLPDVPSAQQISENGLNLGDMNRLLMKKVEELTLYLIEKDQNDKNQQGQIDLLKKQLAQQQTLINSIIHK